MVLCADGLSGIKEPIAAGSLGYRVSSIIVPQGRTSLKHGSYKDRKAFATDWKTIYHAPSEEKGHENE